MTRPRLRRRAAITALVAGLVGAVVGLAVTGTGEPASALRLLTGDAWLDNASAGSVSHVSGYTGQADAQTAVGKPGDPFEVVQRADGAYVLDLRTGRLSRLDDSSLSVGATAAETGTPAALQVVAGTSTTWLVDRSSGIVQQVNPSTLAPIGNQIPLGGPAGGALVDTGGSLWVPLATPGQVAEVNPDGAVARQAFGRPGDQVQVADTSTGVWGVDAAAATAGALEDHAAHAVALPANAPGSSPLVGGSATSADLVVVEGRQVLDVDTSVSSLSSLALPAAARATQVAVSQGRAYLLDPAVDQLESFNLAPLQPLPPVTVPAGSTQLVSKDNLVFVNSPGSPQALVVNADGAVTPITKYVPAAPAGGVGPNSGSSGPAGGPAHGRSPAVTSQPSPVGPGNTASAPSGPAATAPAATTSPATTSLATGAGPPATTTPPPPTLSTPATSTAGPPPSPATTQPPTVPGVPAISQVTAGDGVITVSWSPPASDGGSPVLRYQVTATPSGTSHVVASGTGSVTFSGLTDGVRECVQVQAFNQVGAGPLSPAGQSCATPLKDSPGQVTNVRASESAAGQVRLSWSAPSLGPYHTPIRSYTVHGGPAPVTAPGLATTISGLASGSAYAFTVVATNTAGNSGPASATTGVNTWATPGSVRSLTVTAGDGQLAVKWGAASVPKGSPAVSRYEVSVAGSTHSTTGTTWTTSAPAWSNETVKVYAVNSVGSGPTSTASGTAWARVSTVLCDDSLSGDSAVLNQGLCPAPPGAWTSKGNSGISWISAQAGHSAPGVVNDYLCITYYSGSVSGDIYALVDRPTEAACTAALPGYQKNVPKPDIPHVIAYVSTKSLGSGSQHICDYEGHTTGKDGTYTSYELSPCGKTPSGLSGGSQKFSFYT